MTLLKQLEDNRRRICYPDKLRTLNKLGYKTSGYENELEEILNNSGYGLPGFITEKNADDENVYFGFTINNSIYLYFNYADSLAGMIIELHNKNLL